MAADDSIKLSDFGRARHVSEDGSHVPNLGKLQGSYAHSAPEIYFGKNYSVQSDVFSFGVVLWEMVNCLLKGHYEQPYSDSDEIVYHFQIIVQSAKKNLRPTMPARLPESLRDLITRCWKKEPDERSSVEDITQDLEDIQRAYNSDKSAWNALPPQRA